MLELNDRYYYLRKFYEIKNRFRRRKFVNRAFKLRLFLHWHEKYAKREAKAKAKQTHNLEMEEVSQFYANKTLWHFAHHKLFSTHWIAESRILTFSQPFTLSGAVCSPDVFPEHKGKKQLFSDGKINANKAYKKVNRTSAMQTEKLFGIPCHSKQLFHFRFCVLRIHKLLFTQNPEN